MKTLEYFCFDISIRTFEKMEVEFHRPLFDILKDNREWIKKNESLIKEKIKSFCESLPETDETRKSLEDVLKRFEMIPDVEKKFKVTKTHETLASLFMNQVFTGYSLFFLIYLDNVIPMFKAQQAPNNEEDAFKLELLQKCSELVSAGKQAHDHLRDAIASLATKIQFPEFFKPSKDDIDKDENVKLMEYSDLQKINSFGMSIKNHFNDNAFIEYGMALQDIEDTFNIELFSNSDQLNIDVFKYIYDFIYIDQKPEGTNETILKDLRNEEIQELLYKTPYAIPINFLLK